jgi:hypothetical protein
MWKLNQAAEDCPNQMNEQNYDKRELVSNLRLKSVMVLDDAPQQSTKTHKIPFQFNQTSHGRRFQKEGTAFSCEILTSALDEVMKQFKPRILGILWMRYWRVQGLPPCDAHLSSIDSVWTKVKSLSLVM